ncbi:hypothetical protein BX598_1427 [Micrococcaceae bacterium JKS001869]|nr:hypothetical protein BX598_1427 [Micrococcaceae bacterium JKS001869]
MILKASMRASIQALVEPTDKFSVFASTGRADGNLVLKGDVWAPKAWGGPVRPVRSSESRNGRHGHNNPWLMEGRHRLCGMHRVYPVVAVQEHDDMAPGGGEASISRSCRARILLADHPQSIITADEGGGDGDS